MVHCSTPLTSQIPTHSVTFHEKGNEREEQKVADSNSNQNLLLIFHYPFQVRTFVNSQLDLDEFTSHGPRGV
jgi:hypothetical protein